MSDQGRSIFKKVVVPENRKLRDCEDPMRTQSFFTVYDERSLLFQHEKYSSQLQMTLKASEGKKTELEDRTRAEKTPSAKSMTQGMLPILQIVLQTT